MIYGVNRPVSLYFPHKFKSASQPPPMGSFRVDSGPRPLSLWHVLSMNKLSGRMNAAMLVALA